MSAFGGLFLGLLVILFGESAAPLEPDETLIVDQRVNRVKNPSFEFRYTPGTGGSIPMYWSRFTGGASTLAVSAAKKQGDYSFKITDNSSTAAVGLWSDPVPVTSGWVYTARVWASRSSSTMDSRMYIKFFDAATNLLSTLPSQPVGSVGSWSEGAKTFAAPTGAAYVRILLYSGSASAGYAYFDCVSLVLADERVYDGDFGTALAGQLPDFWSVFSGLDSPQTQQTFDDNGNLMLRIYDGLADTSSGASYIVPSTPGVPYTFSASVRRVDISSSYPSIYLKFYSSNHTQIGTASSYTTSTNFVPLSVSLTAPAGTAYAKLVCYMSVAGTGTVDFDNIFFTENYVDRYASPAGTGDGLTPATPALYCASNFWNEVDTAAASGPVRVVLQDGDYVQWLEIAGVGNATNRILVVGEHPFAANFSATENINEYLWLHDCQNMVFRHLHFTASESPEDLAVKDPEVYDYLYAMRIGDPDRPTSNIRCEGLTFTDLLLMRYGATGAHFDTYGIAWENCSWVRAGWDAYDHCIYNANSSYDLRIANCFFQDANGAYVRFRNRSVGTVENSTFLSTGVQPNGSPWGHVHHPFIQLAAVNPEGYGRDELLGADFQFQNNSFTYENTSAVGKRCPYSIKVDGVAPVSQPTYFLVPPADGAAIKDTGNSTSVRNGLVRDYFGIDMADDVEIGSNIYTGCWSALFTLSCKPADTNYWYQELWNDESMNCDISALPGL